MIGQQHNHILPISGHEDEMVKEHVSYAGTSLHNAVMGQQSYTLENMLDKTSDITATSFVERLEEYDAEFYICRIDLLNKGILTNNTE